MVTKNVWFLRYHVVILHALPHQLYSTCNICSEATLKAMSSYSQGCLGVWGIAIARSGLMVVLLSLVVWKLFEHLKRGYISFEYHSIIIITWTFSTTPIDHRASI